MFSFVRHMLRGFLIVVLCAALVPSVAFACVMGAYIFLPLPANLPSPNASAQAAQGSHIYDVNGNEIAFFQGHDRNIPVTEDDIPAVLKQATVASEDKNFYEHHGVDPRGTLRALVADLKHDEVVQGGSTITQQYVKLAYTNGEVTVSRKVKEAVLAGQLDRKMNKDEILWRYLSIAYFGEGNYGIGAAADSYFHKSVKDLTLSEAATLVGVIPAPSAYAPRDNVENAEIRRKVVLGKMLQEGHITQQQFDETAAQPLWLESQGEPTTPVTKVLNEEQQHSSYPYYTDYVRKYLEIKYGADAVYKNGLRVQTAMDPKLQTAADEEVANTLKGTSPPLEMALASVEPPTGFVRALVGGRDYTKSKVNLALGGCPTTPSVGGKAAEEQVKPSCRTDKVPTSGGTGRQPGSSFKAFVLASAYEVGIQPTAIYNAPSAWSPPGCTGANCAVHNYEGEAGGSVNLKEATADSLNTVFAPLIRDVGTKQSGKVVDGFIHTADLAKRLGITSAYYAQDFHRTGGNYALGTIDVSPLDMAAAYGVFADRGLRQVATPIVKIVDRNGRVLEDNTSREPTRVLDEAVADNVTDALKGVIEHGTAASRGKIDRPAAGKTGTAQAYQNAWFVGYTPELSTAVWMGYSDAPRTINYKGNTRIAGGTVPTQTWAAYMKRALEGVPATEFSQPAKIKAPDKNVLGQVGGGANVPQPIAPQSNRTVTTTPAGDYDRSNPGTPSVAAPVTTTTTVPGAAGPVTGSTG